jgi:hypothetical protein
MNMFDTGMFGMLPPEERKKILEGGSLYGGSLQTAGGAVDQTQTQQKEPWHKGWLWNKGKKQKDKGISFLEGAESTGVIDDKTGAQILPSDKRYPTTQLPKTTLFDPSQGRKTDNIDTLSKEDPSFVDKLLRLTGTNKAKAMATWKEKGGFEGLMANPAFSLGLAMMQSSAQGKRIDEDLLNNFVKAAGISTTFKDRLEANAGQVIQVTSAQMDDAKSFLKAEGYDKPGWVRTIWPGNQTAKWEEAVERVALETQKAIVALKEKAKASRKDIYVDSRMRRRIMKEIIASGDITTHSNIPILQDPTLYAKKAEGGPVAAGQTYVVGEGGPEYFLPKESGKVLSNDDSRIFSMLLAANPQLQNVSKTRSEKILRNRFPEYFE